MNIAQILYILFGLLMVAFAFLAEVFDRSHIDEWHSAAFFMLVGVIVVYFWKKK